MKYPADTLEVCDFYNYVKILNWVPSWNKKYLPSLYKHQADIANLFICNNRIITKSSENMGMTTLMLCLAHWYCHKFFDFKICYITYNAPSSFNANSLFHNMDATRSLFMCSYTNKIELKNGSSIRFMNDGFELLCGHTFDMLLIDNMDTIYDVDEDSWNDLFRRLSPNGHCFINSCPHLNGYFFRKLYESKNEFKKFHFPLKTNPKLFKKISGNSLMLTAQYKNEVEAKWLDEVDTKTVL